MRHYNATIFIRLAVVLSVYEERKKEQNETTLVFLHRFARSDHKMNYIINYIEQYLCMHNPPDLVIDPNSVLLVNSNPSPAQDYYPDIILDFSIDSAFDLHPYHALVSNLNLALSSKTDIA
ncbi:hypothetical protein EVAR_38958_1 [Eumeta japonica]|uniref:Uncharacterized protein n=1 Tax=Eumeta variegata TaxID=151549 RepID=A0A4C1WB28_EUMVA|nr:hypothetical protein EVAR_38958_1 [Eumeta japonica]